MHVLHVIDGLGLGGAERMLVDIANRTVDDGHRVTVCVTRENVTLARELDPSVELLLLHRRARISPLALIRLARFIRAQRVDVIHVHLRSNLAFVLQLRLVHVVSTPIVFHDHTSFIEHDPTIPVWFRIGRRHIDHYVGVYDDQIAWAHRAGVDSRRTSIIPNGVDLSRFERAEVVNLRDEVGAGDRLLAILVASLRPEKTIELVLRALSRSAARDRLVVVIVGPDGVPDYAASCRALATALGLDKIVVFAGSRTDVPSLLPSADLGLLTSSIESGPLALIEYLAAGLPVVSTRVGDVGRRLADHGVPGFVAPGDVEAFARELDAYVALTPAERRARADRGRALLRERWDIRAAMPRWYAAYRSVISDAA